MAERMFVRRAAEDRVSDRSNSRSPDGRSTRTEGSRPSRYSVASSRATCSAPGNQSSAHRGSGGTIRFCTCPSPWKVARLRLGTSHRRAAASASAVA